VPVLHFAGQLFAAELDLVHHDPGHALVPAILAGSSGYASATALDLVAAWHWPGGPAGDGYGPGACGGTMSG
jgi:hypothetical protein